VDGKDREEKSSPSLKIGRKDDSKKEEGEEEEVLGDNGWIDGLGLLDGLGQRMRIGLLV